MNNRIAEYTSHRNPKVTRVQFEGHFQILGGFVVAASDARMARQDIWYLVEEALEQNTRYFCQKPLRLFMLEVDEKLVCTCFKIVAVSENEIRFRRTLFAPSRLRRAASEQASRTSPQLFSHKEIEP
jgi:hypothetical protein